MDVDRKDVFCQCYRTLIMITFVCAIQNKPVIKSSAM